MFKFFLTYAKIMHYLLFSEKKFWKFIYYWKFITIITNIYFSTISTITLILRAQLLLLLGPLLLLALILFLIPTPTINSITTIKYYDDRSTMTTSSKPTNCDPPSAARCVFQFGTYFFPTGDFFEFFNSDFRFWN